MRCASSLKAATNGVSDETVDSKMTVFLRGISCLWTQPETYPRNVPTSPESVTSTAVLSFDVGVPDVSEMGGERNAMWSRSVCGVIGSELAGEPGRRMMACVSSATPACASTVFFNSLSRT